jgi:hypothetical protein
MKFKRDFRDKRVEDKAESTNVQGDYREQYPAYDADEMHGEIGKFRPFGDKDFFSEAHLLEFYRDDLRIGMEGERKFFYRELLAVLITVAFVTILVVANSVHLR